MFLLEAQPCERIQLAGNVHPRPATIDHLVVTIQANRVTVCEEQI